MTDNDSGNLIVREATLDDVIGIVYVQATMWINDYRSDENGILEPDIRSIDFKSKIINWQHIIRSPNYKAWVAVNDSKIVGTLAVLKEAELAEIYELCVLPDYQGRGTGTKLWLQAAEWLGELPVRVRIISYHEPSAAFYKDLGFSVSTLGEVDFIALPSGKNIPTIEMHKGDFVAATDSLENTTIDNADDELLDNKDLEHREAVRPITIQQTLIGRAELARSSGVRASTIKYYTEIGLLPFEQAEARLARRYNKTVAMTRLQDIQHLRNQGLSIKDITKRLQ